MIRHRSPRGDCTQVSDSVVPIALGRSRASLPNGVVVLIASGRLKARLHEVLAPGQVRSPAPKAPAALFLAVRVPTRLCIDQANFCEFRKIVVDGIC